MALTLICVFTFRFHSDDSDDYSGFKIVYKLFEAPQWSYNNGACGGSFTTPNGILTSPSYPYQFPDNRYCIYTITQPMGSVVVLTFHLMDIPSTGIFSCFTQYLKIRDGSSNDSPILDKLCGKKEFLGEMPAPIQSSQNHLFIE